MRLVAPSLTWPFDAPSTRSVISIPSIFQSWSITWERQLPSLRCHIHEVAFIMIFLLSWTEFATWSSFVGFYSRSSTFISFLNFIDMLAIERGFQWKDLDRSYAFFFFWNVISISLSFNRWLFHIFWDQTIYVSMFVAPSDGMTLILSIWDDWVCDTQRHTFKNASLSTFSSTLLFAS